MIKIILILWLVGIHAVAFLAIWDTDLAYRINRKLDLDVLNPPELTRLYEDMLGSHLQLDGSVEEGSVIFLGDSLIQGLNVAAVTSPAINYGIGMDTTVGLLERLPQYASLKKASTIVIAIGVNDIFRARRSPEAILKNYQQIFSQLPSKSRIVVQAVFPVDESKDLPEINDKITALNTMLKAAATRNGYAFITLQERFADRDGNLQKSLHVGDGIHLNTEGYRLWIQALNQHLSPVKN